MKQINYKKVMVGAAFAVALLVAGSNNVFAQRRGHSSERGSSERVYYKRGGEQKHKKDKSGKRSHKKDRITKKVHKKHGEAVHHSRHPRNYGYYHTDRSRRYKGAHCVSYPHNVKHYSHKRAHRPHRYSYHPRYGRVVVAFGTTPLRFTNDYGRYYYSNGDYYRYHSGVGYILVDAPREMYFRDLPEGYHRVKVRDRVYYRCGDQYFSHGNKGFHLVAQPDGIHLGVSF